MLLSLRGGERGERERRGTINVVTVKGNKVEGSMAHVLVFHNSLQGSTCAYHIYIKQCVHVHVCALIFYPQNF